MRVLKLLNKELGGKLLKDIESTELNKELVLESKIMIEKLIKERTGYPDVSKVYDLDGGMFISVDQINSNEDKTCLCLSRLEDGVVEIKAIKYIEKQKDIDKYINENMSEIYKAFGFSNLE